VARGREPALTPAWPTTDGSESVLGLLARDARGPGEIAAHEERLRLVRACLDGIEVARLKLVEDLPDNEIAGGAPGWGALCPIWDPISTSRGCRAYSPTVKR
jgi:hypothetical protein